MLKRIISGILLFVVLIPIVISNGKPFLIMIGVLSLLALKEIFDLKKSRDKYPSGIEFAAMISMFLLIFYEYEVHGETNGVSSVLLSLLSIVFLLPTMLTYKNTNYETKDAFYLIGVLLFLSTAFHQVIVLRNQNVWLLLYILLISTITDIFAYLVGKLMGKKKIFPTISPNKTYAGTIGGVIFGTIIPTVFYALVISNECILEVAITSFNLSIISVFGDLLFSKIKRENNIKDFSDLIPGHGGILDRFDSFIFVVLAYTIIQRFI